MTMNPTHLRLLDLFKYYNRLSHQTAAIHELEDEINALDPYILDRNASWYRTWVSAVAPKAGIWIVSRQQIAAITNRKPEEFDDKFMSDLNMLVRVTDMTSLNQRRHLVSQTCHETGGYRWMKELSDGLYLRGRTDLGHGPNEGELWKGAGAIQLTGKYNYSRFESWLEKNGMKDDNVVTLGCDYVSKKYPFLSGVCWIEENNWARVCEGEDVYQVTRVLNGGYNGIDDRLHYYDLACKYITA